jgi:hypothetical protein
MGPGASLPVPATVLMVPALKQVVSVSAKAEAGRNDGVAA